MRLRTVKPGSISLMTERFLAVCITTRNRYEIFKKSYSQWEKFLPANSRIFVVDDASSAPCPEADFHFRTNVGIARAKNKCLELAEAFNHIILADDDVWPIAQGWEKPYVESIEPHLMLCWEESPRSRAFITKRYKGLEVYSRPRGAMMYIERGTLRKVGGLNPNFGKWGYEHIDWSSRIYNMGYTKYPFQDVENSEKLIFSLDRHDRYIKSTVPFYAQQKALKQFHQAYQLSKKSKQFYDWREQ